MIDSKFSFCLILLWSGCVSLINGANILGLMPMLSPSHHLWNSVLMHRLGELGHNVTILSVDLPKPNEKLPPNVHYIFLEKGYTIYDPANIKLDINDFIHVGPIESVQVFNEAAITGAEVVLASEGFQTLLNYPDDFKFDLVIHDYTMGALLLGFLPKFNYPPLIGISPFPNPPATIDYMSNHYFPAYVPYYSTMFSSDMNFWQRFENTLVTIYDTAYRRLILTPKLNAMAREYFPKDMPYLDDLANYAITMVNSHPAINFMDVLPPGVIEVGGLQIRDPKPLPNDLEEFINKSVNGAILFSFGTNMKGNDFSREQIRTIINAMAELPQYNFLWKFDVNFLKEKIPKNVLVRLFYPQGDILAHPKVKAFVTHCGGLSSHEAVWYGVPMVGVPLFIDQHRNLQQSLLAGIAVKVDYPTMTTKDIVQAIKKVTEDPQIQANSKTKSKQYRDRPMKPLDTAVWWVDYVLRNPNLSHLKSPALKLNIFQANSLDCLFVMLLLVVAALYVVCKVLTFALRLVNPASPSKKIKQN